MRVWRVAVLVTTVIVMTAWSLPHVPRVWLDYRGWPFLEAIDQPEHWGTDTIADLYATRVVRHDPLDMYTRRFVEQTPLERATWTKEASAPYPPIALLVMTGMAIAGDATGIGYYGVVLLLAACFLALSLVYFVRTRWYLFPLLYLNFGYLAERFVHVQDGSYLVLLNVVMAALLAARAGSPARHVLMATAAVIKLSPLYYLKNLGAMSPAVAGTCLAIALGGLVLPAFVLEDYLSIYTFGYGLRGSDSGALAALAVAAVFAVLIAYLDGKGAFDAEDRIGWALVPIAVFLALKLNAPRHLILVLLVPDKRGLRNVAVAGALLLHTLAPGVIRFGSVGPLAMTVLLTGLVVSLSRIGWRTVLSDLRRPGHLLRLLARPA